MGGEQGIKQAEQFYHYTQKHGYGKDQVSLPRSRAPAVCLLSVRLSIHLKRARALAHTDRRNRCGRRWRICKSPRSIAPLSLLRPRLHLLACIPLLLPCFPSSASFASFYRSAHTLTPSLSSNTHARMRKLMDACMPACIHATCINICMHARMHIHKHEYVHTCAHVYLHT